MKHGAIGIAAVVLVLAGACSSTSKPKAKAPPAVKTVAKSLPDDPWVYFVVRDHDDGTLDIAPDINGDPSGLTREQLESVLDRVRCDNGFFGSLAPAPARGDHYVSFRVLGDQAASVDGVCFVASQRFFAARPKAVFSPAEVKLMREELRDMPATKLIFTFRKADGAPGFVVESDRGDIGYLELHEMEGAEFSYRFSNTIGYQ